MNFETTETTHGPTTSQNAFVNCSFLNNTLPHPNISPISSSTKTDGRKQRISFPASWIYWVSFPYFLHPLLSFQKGAMINCHETMMDHMIVSLEVVNRILEMIFFQQGAKAR